LILAAASLAINLTATRAAAAVLGLSDHLPALAFPQIVPVSVLPVLGYGFGFYMSYRSRRPRALLLFIGPGAAIFLALIIKPALGLLNSGSLASFAVTLLVNAVPVLVAVPVLLRLRPDTTPSADPSGTRTREMNDDEPAQVERS